MRLILGDCVERMAELDPESIDAVVCDPPYGLEFMGKEWDSFRGDAWRATAGFSKPGIGQRERAWPSFGAGDAANATCATCGGRMRGANRCSCDVPEWRVKGEPLGTRNGRLEQMRAFESWTAAWATEALRILRPGGYLLAFGGTRTYHRLAAGIEDAGFEIRDQIAWLYGQGFPKSLDVAKAIAKLGLVGEIHERTDGRYAYGFSEAAKRALGATVAAANESGFSGKVGDYAPAGDEARARKGWGTALKPALEPIVVARKPLAGTVAENVLAHGTGAINVDGCRIAEAKGDGNWAGRDLGESAWFIADQRDEDPGEANEFGRWPANVVLDEDAAALLDEQTGGELLAASGGASRFFYSAKTSRAERGAGLASLGETSASSEMLAAKRVRQCRVCASRTKPPGPNPDPWPACGHADWEWVDQRTEPSRNTHPTVKPISLMRWLVRLVTPPGGTVLDPFLGSGTTGIAAALEGFDFVGVERDPEYLAIAEARIRFWAEHGEETLRRVAERDSAERDRRDLADAGQLDLFATEGEA